MTQLNKYNIPATPEEVLNVLNTTSASAEFRELTEQQVRATNDSLLLELSTLSVWPGNLQTVDYMEQLFQAHPKSEVNTAQGIQIRAGRAALFLASGASQKYILKPSVLQSPQENGRPVVSDDVMCRQLGRVLELVDDSNHDVEVRFAVGTPGNESVRGYFYQSGEIPPKIYMEGWDLPPQILDHPQNIIDSVRMWKEASQLALPVEASRELLVAQMKHNGMGY